MLLLCGKAVSAAVQLPEQDLLRRTVSSDGYMATSSYNRLTLIHPRLLMASSSETQQRGSHPTPVTSEKIKEELGLEFLTVSVANRVREGNYLGIFGKNFRINGPRDPELWMFLILANPGPLVDGSLGAGSSRLLQSLLCSCVKAPLSKETEDHQTLVLYLP